MKVLLEIKDKKAPFVLELLDNLSFVKAKQITPHHAQVLEELKEAVENMSLAKEGKLKPRPASELLDEL